jgi:hypothetical protein
VKREKILRASFRSPSGNDIEDGLSYEVQGKEAKVNREGSALHKYLKRFGYVVRTDYGVRRLFPEDGDIFVRNLPKEFPGPKLKVELEEVDPI